MRLEVKNSLPDETTVHWHGIDVPNAMDGVPDVTQEPIARERRRIAPRSSGVVLPRGLADDEHRGMGGPVGDALGDGAQ